MFIAPNKVLSCHSTWWLEIGPFFQPCSPPTTLQKLSLFHSNPESVCIFSGKGKKLADSSLFPLLSLVEKKKKIEATTPALLCRDWILGGDPAKDYWGGAAPCRVCTHKKANALIAQSCFTQKVWLVPNKAPNDSFFSFSFTLTPSRAAYDFFNSLRNILLEHQFVNY